MRSGFLMNTKRTLARAVLLPLVLASVTLQTVTDGLSAQEWSLGRYSLLRGASSGPLRMSMTGTALRSARFVGRVGGVAFAAVASPDPLLSSALFDVRYDARAPDGQRLTVRSGGLEGVAAIPDWQLLPILELAGSETDAVVSLFGDNGTETHYEATYHEALMNTLLGLRLLQADMLLMDLDLAHELPALDGHVVLGAGEGRANPEIADVAAARILMALSAADFQSWVLTDDGEDFVFDVANGVFTITGDPYYYFWRYSEEYYQVTDQIERLGLGWQQNIERYNAQVGQYNLASAVSNGVGMERAERALDSLSLVMRTDSIEIERLITALDEQEDEGRQVQEDTVTTATLAGQWSAIRGLNPAVATAAERTARYGAFFRFVRTEHPAIWSRLLRSVQGLTPSPSIQTPNRIPRAVAGR